MIAEEEEGKRGRGVEGRAPPSDIAAARCGGCRPTPIQKMRLGTRSPIRDDVGLVRTLKLLWGSLCELTWFLGMPGLWAWQAVRLFAFVVTMLPVFVPVFVHFLLSKRILKNLTYGPSIRHQLDVYLPSKGAAERANNKCPVVIFVSGGAWIIGYKLWSFLMGCVLQVR